MVCIYSFDICIWKIIFVHLAEHIAIAAPDLPDSLVRLIEEEKSIDLLLLFHVQLVV
jgi:hypothetical protein